MKKFLSSVLILSMVFGIFHGMTSTTVQAQEVQSTVLIGGSEKLLLEVGKSYNVPVSFMKADTPTEASMATDSLTGSILTANADGTVTVQFQMTDITIMTAWGFAESLSMNNEHVMGGDATSMTIASTYSKKLTYLFSSKTYTIPSVFSGTMPYLDQNGVYAKMELKTGITDMSQEGYFVFGFGSLVADYQAVNAALANVPADLTIYTAESVNVLNAALSEVEFYYHKDRQVEVTSMAVALASAIDALEIDTTTRINADVYGTVLATPSTFTVSIPESIQLGTLSTNEDTVIDYQLGVNIHTGNDGKELLVIIKSTGDNTLVQGDYKLPFVNSLTSYMFSTSEVIDETLTVEAVGTSYYGDYQGTIIFEINSAYVD